MIDALGGGFRQSLFMVADEMGFDVDPQLQTTHEMAVATEPIDSPIGPIQPGTVAAQRFTWEATVDGVPVVTATVNWLMGEEHLDPALDVRARRRALRGRDHRRSQLPHHLQEAAPQDGGGGPRPQSRRRRHGHALRQRHPVRLPGRARPAHLPRDASGGRPRCSGLASGPAGIASPLRHDPRPLLRRREGGDRHRRRAGDRTGDRHRVRRGRRGRRAGRPHRVRPRGGGRAGPSLGVAGPSSCRPTSPTPPPASSW